MPPGQPPNDEPLAVERRLHPLTLVFEFASMLREQVVPLFAAVVGGFSAEGATGAAFGLLALVTIFAVASVARYLRFTYRYDADELVIRSGVLVRTERHIPYARIQNIDAVQNVIQRMLDVVVIHVQTGSGSEPEASLRVLPVTALDEMRRHVSGLRARPVPADRGGHVRAEHGAESAPMIGAGAPVGTAPDATGLEPAATAAPDTAARPPDSDAELDAEDERLLLHLPARDLLLAGFIDNRGLIVILGLLAILERGNVLERIAPVVGESAVRALLGQLAPGGTLTVPGALAALVIVLSFLFLVRLLSTVWTAARLHDYRLVRTGAELRAEYGLFTRVTATVPLRRVQLVSVRERLLHRLAGRLQVSVVTAGGTGRTAGAPRRERIAPILRRERLVELLEELQPGLDTSAIEWRPVHPRAFGRMLRAGLVWPVVLAAVSYPFIDAWAAAVLALLFVRLVFDRTLRARYLGWSMMPDAFAVRAGALTRETRVARFDRMQVIDLRANPFDRRTGMARLGIATAGAGGGLGVPYLPAESAERLYAGLSARVGASEFTW